MRSVLGKLRHAGATEGAEPRRRRGGNEPRAVDVCELSVQGGLVEMAGGGQRGICHRVSFLETPANVLGRCTSILQPLEFDLHISFGGVRVAYHVQGHSPAAAAVERVFGIISVNYRGHPRRTE